ncbi:MAG: phosphodiester glycosidase family protein [Streptococcaceae bacterium]|jgi:exopolysaccharide biosynthesis protein|nr:phosphodiester glycosidase family protein [Streptococcaceae bacterium]
MAKYEKSYERPKEIKKTKGRLVILIIFLLVLLAVTLFFLFFNKSKPNSQPTNNLGQNPTKTNSGNGYISNSSAPAAIGTAEVVADAGTAQWVQIKSSKKEKKFTDLSEAGIKIIKANNPLVLKTATSHKTPTRLLSEVMADYPDAAIMNASGFDMSTGSVLGFQINNGKLFGDWTGSGEASFVINSDGTCAAYDSTSSASEILQKGAAMSFTFSSILVKNGTVQPNDGSFDWKKHALIGNDAENNIYLIITDTNYSYDMLLKIVSGFKMQNLVQMDGGGSSQLALKGKVLFPSEDNRAIPDYIVLK